MVQRFNIGTVAVGSVPKAKAESKRLAKGQVDAMANTAHNTSSATPTHQR
jgi:hypothetical protein